MTPAEKLTLLMLADLMKALKVESDLEPDFIRETVLRGQTWALGWQYPVLDVREEPAQGVVEEVGRIMSMWRVVEDSYAALDPAEQAKVRASYFDTEPKFDGFDGNNEGDHFGVALFLVNHLERFQEFKGRDLNSHHPTLDRARRSLPVFEGILARRHVMTADDLVSILSA
jgi:uncharacterized protein